MSLLVAYIVLMITGDFPGDVFSVPVGRLGHRGAHHAAKDATSIGRLSGARRPRRRCPSNSVRRCACGTRACLRREPRKRQKALLIKAMC